MPSVKKAEQKAIRLIEETEAIAALEILLSENDLIHSGNSNVYFRLSYKTENLRKSFYKTYKHDCEKVLRDILAWCTYVFTEARQYSAIEIYRKYAECVSLLDKQPMKALLPSNPLSIQWRRRINQHQNDFEININPTKSSTVWLFKGFRYEVNPLYTDEEAKLLILEDFDKERRYFEKLKAKFDETPSKEILCERPRIPEKVRIEVWRRDGGKCAKCGSQEKLEYDHIIPISRGGSNTARNIELLCEKHNRSKSNNIV
jgi:hypothetical protein